MFVLQAAGARIAMGELDALSAIDLPPAIVRGVVINRPMALLRAIHAATADLERGRPRSARAHIQAIDPTDADLFAGPASSLIAITTALLGEVDPAEASLERARRLAGRAGSLDPFLDHAVAWTLSARHRPAEARAVVRSATETHLDGGRVGWALPLAHLLARLGGTVDAARLEARIPATIPGRLPAARRAHIRTLADTDPDGLSAVATMFATIGADLLAAEAWSQASVAYRRAGDPRRATRALQEARLLAARCEGARTPGLVVPTDELAPLSGRELEIAQLAGSGLSSAQIAARLVLSPRTVDNHLQRVYQKLGITSRSELRAALGAPAEQAPRP
jgi:DNA-binding CsgD family transcriptional regulator